MERTSTGAGELGRDVDASLRTTLRRFNDAFNGRDPEKFAAFWTDDGTLWNPLGHYAEGRVAIERLYREDGMKIYEGASARHTVTAIRKLRDDCALVDFDNDVENFRRPDGSRGALKMHVTLLAVKRGTEWQWQDLRAFAYMPRPPELH